ncbi:MAG: hypothetical protein ACLRP8_17225 [Roseburia intestinalis]
MNVIPNPRSVLFITVLIMGTAAAAFFGFLIGIPVLRLRGDYLAIVTLAFGEIIKNVINATLYRKRYRWFSFCDFKWICHIKLSDDGRVVSSMEHKELHRTPHVSNFTDRCDSDSDLSFHCHESGKFQKRTRDHGHP